MDATTDAPLIEIEDFVVLTDRDLSMLGEARHKTIGGRGVVGRLIATWTTTTPTRSTGSHCKLDFGEKGQDHG